MSPIDCLAFHLALRFLGEYIDYLIIDGIVIEHKAGPTEASPYCFRFDGIPSSTKKVKRLEKIHFLFFIGVAGRDSVTEKGTSIVNFHVLDNTLVADDLLHKNVFNL
jgi:hypothetical protein